MVHKFLHNIDDDASGYEKSIKRDLPNLAFPRQSEFLVMSDAAKTTLKSCEDDYGLRIDDIAKTLDFERALQEVGRQISTKRKFDEIPWQIHATSSFCEEERWVFGCKAQKLWPYEKSIDTGRWLTVLYPDLFEDLGFEEQEHVEKDLLSEPMRWQDVMESKSLGDLSATLPLAKALGAIVTPHLHSGVTHVLCDLKRHKMLKWTSMLPINVYSDAESGLRLHERLNSLEESAALESAIERSVLLVTPDWLEEQWDKNNKSP